MHGVEFGVKDCVCMSRLRRILQKVLLQVIHHDTTVHAGSYKSPTGAVYVYTVHASGTAANARHRQGRLLTRVPHFNHACLFAGTDKITRRPIQPCYYKHKNPNATKCNQRKEEVNNSIQ